MLKRETHYFHSTVEAWKNKTSDPDPEYACEPQSIHRLLNPCGRSDSKCLLKNIQMGALDASRH